MPLTHLRRLWYRHQSRWAHADWDTLLRGLPAARHLNAAERERAGQLAIAFLADKVIERAGGTGAGADTEVDDGTRLLIAANAALPILNIGLDGYDGWHAVIVYPHEFIATGEYTDEDGIVHSQRRVLSGESWHQGPVILSQTDVHRSMHGGDNVVIHELAHKLDLGNGRVNGMPPLPANMDWGAWTGAMSDGYERLCNTVDTPQALPFDPYACESPGEFFAVMSETFFVDPIPLRQHLPRVYQQLAAYYGQNPAGLDG